MKNEVRIKEMNFEQIKQEITKDCGPTIDLKDKARLKQIVSDWMKKEK